jgi:hypothetical protein
MISLKQSRRMTKDIYKIWEHSWNDSNTPKKTWTIFRTSRSHISMSHHSFISVWLSTIRKRADKYIQSRTINFYSTKIKQWETGAISRSLHLTAGSSSFFHQITSFSLLIYWLISYFFLFPSYVATQTDDLELIDWNYLLSFCKMNESKNIRN